MWRMSITRMTFVVVVTRLQMHRRLLSAAMTTVTLVTITTMCSGLSAVARSGPINVGSTRSLLRRHLLLHHDDFVLVLDTAASMTVLGSSRVVLRRETLELYLYLVLGIAPVSAPAAAPTDAHVTRPAGGPLPLHTARPRPHTSVGLQSPPR